jgi:hypothetical protein
VPYSSHWVDPEVAIEWHGVKVYNTYKDDDFESGASSYWFTLHEERGYESGEDFDIRDLPNYPKDEQIPFKDEDVRHYAILKEAIDLGYLKPIYEETI